MEVRNYMEVVVQHLLPGILKRNPEVCSCERCIADIKAIALNSLPPKYIASESGEVYSKIHALSLQFEVDVTNAILHAMNKVKNKPQH
ncbi:late competence development ComFB family protein [Clostridium formicaceticum]|uniref:Competence protein ComFB n=1 Tax=Clostridium formicaceticum TaxID=1497 RepID=A0AAC9RI94_9CLOT|nr:late competence development ComFB family protein [Clostridium formicaceticum]AOY77057.1 competence protein ComFB [Clostridium formicaceticum]ARE87559.1 Late competence development protein ComFB [Clostridium formicaceticum]